MIRSLELKLNTVVDRFAHWHWGCLAVQLTKLQCLRS